MDKVFISYSHDDQGAAKLIANRLTAAGFEVFFDQNVIVAGDSFSKRISAALQDAAAVVVLLSSKSRRSSWVEDELQTALESKKLVVPVLLDEGAEQNWLWPLVAQRQSISLDLGSPDLRAQLDHLVSRLSVLSRDNRSAPSRAPEAALTMGVSVPTIWRTVAIAIISAILGAAIATWLLR